jgi:hypothetical protein
MILGICLQSLVKTNTEELARLSRHISHLQEAVDKQSHEVVCASSSMQTEHKQLKLLEDNMLALREHIVSFNTRLQALGGGVRNLLGDSMLAAALVVHAGTLSWPDKTASVKRWQAVLAEEDIPYASDFSLCGFMESTHRQHKLLPRSVLLDDSMQTNLYAVALVCIAHVLCGYAFANVAGCQVTHHSVR